MQAEVLERQAGQDGLGNIEERVRLLNRLRRMLVLQREKFRSYLHVLEKQEDAIINIDSEALEVQMSVEHQIIQDIRSVQKVITPLDVMYQKLYPNKKGDITQLQERLEHLRGQAIIHNAHNRELLTRHRDELKKQIAAFRIPRSRKSVYANEAQTSMVDISC